MMNTIFATAFVAALLVLPSTASAQARQLLKLDDGVEAPAEFNQASELIRGEISAVQAKRNAELQKRRRLLDQIAAAERMIRDEERKPIIPRMMQTPDLDPMPQSRNLALISAKRVEITNLKNSAAQLKATADAYLPAIRKLQDKHDELVGFLNNVHRRAYQAKSLERTMAQVERSISQPQAQVASRCEPLRLLETPVAPVPVPAVNPVTGLPVAAGR